METAARQPLLKVEHLKQYFKVNKSFTVKAVDDISFEIFPGETYGLVGESGSGKSTTGRSVIRLYDPTGGTITFNGENITGKMTAAQTKMLRTKMQMIFQDPMASLNPREKVIDIIAQGWTCTTCIKTPPSGVTKCIACWSAWASRTSMPTATRTSFPRGNASALALRVRW